MQKILIIIINHNFKLYPPFYENMQEIISKYNIRVFIFVKLYESGKNYTHVGCPVKNANSLKKLGIHVYTYKQNPDLEKHLEVLDNNYEVIFIDTPVDGMIGEINMLRERFGHVVTPDYELFQNKSKQRELIKKNAPELAIKSEKHILKDIDPSITEEKFGYPYIIKPVKGARSQGVEKINKSQDLIKYKKTGDISKEYIVEEYIEGDFLSTECFVDKEGNVSFTYPLLCYTGNMININTFVIAYAKIAEDIIKKIGIQKIEQHIQKVINACNIRNTFICYQCILTPNGKLYPLEINGRIGWGGPMQLKHSFNINLHEYIFLPKQDIDIHIQKYYSMINILATKDGILESYNVKLLQKIQKLPSCKNIDYFSDIYNGKMLRESQEGIFYLGQIIICNNNKKQYEKDLNHVLEHYHEVLIMK